MSSASAANGGRPRLAVNPRRHKVAPRDRKRATVACNSCNTKRVKCSGPPADCEQCRAHKRQCVFPAAQEKMTVSKDVFNNLKAQSEQLIEEQKRRLDLQNDMISSRSLVIPQRAEISSALATSFVEIVPKQDDEDEDDEDINMGYTTSSSTNSDPLLDDSGVRDATRGKLLEDQHGNRRYLGGSSGAIFLDHLRDFMSVVFATLGRTEEASKAASAFASQHGHYQTADSQPMPSPDMSGDPDATLAKSFHPKATRLLNTVDYFVQNNSGRVAVKSDVGKVFNMPPFASGGIYYFRDLHHSTWKKDGQEIESTRKIDVDGFGEVGTAHILETKRANERLFAFYQAAFAYGSLLSLKSADSRRDGALGEVYFRQAERFVHESGHHVDNVPTLALLALYMNEVNRREACCLLLSHATTICINSGIVSGSPCGEREKRAFWTVHVLNRRISCLMGRPNQLSDRDIGLKMPDKVDGFPPPDGLIAHIRLSRIAGFIINTIYGVKLPKVNKQSVSIPTLARQCLSKLRKWLCQLPENLQLALIKLQRPPKLPWANEEVDDADALLAYFPLVDTEAFNLDHAMLSLHMYFNQLIILALRPIFFATIRGAVAVKLKNPDKTLEVDSKLVRICTEAARQNLFLGVHIRKKCSPRQRLAKMDLHHMFNAAVLLRLDQIVADNQRTHDQTNVQSVMLYFADEAKAKDDYGKDCLKVLTELKDVVHRVRANITYTDSNHNEVKAEAIDPFSLIKQNLHKPASSARGSPAHSASTNNLGDIWNGWAKEGSNWEVTAPAQVEQVDQDMDYDAAIY